MACRALARAAAATLLILLWAAQAPAAPITITKLAELNFGFCENLPNATYTVQPAASPGPGACQGATAARFDVTGDPNRRAKLTLPASVTITNGSESLTVSTDESPAGPIICLGSGALTVFVGGSVTLPAGGLATFGLFQAQTSIELQYIGGAC